MSGRRCPACGQPMRAIPGSDRTVKGGTWYELICTSCLFRMDAWKPRRSKRRSS